MQEIKKGWKKVKLGEIALEIRNNFNPKKEREQIYLGLEHIEQQTLRISSYGSSNETLSLKLKFNSGDILFGKMRPYFRKVVKPNFSGVCSGEILVLNSNNGNSQNFLFYVVANEKFIDDVNKTTGGADRPRAKWEVMKNLEIFLPPLPTQQKIASILSKYDDLIENNNKRIKILEETAGEIYEEWFVKYNFPGNENIKMIDSGNDDFGIIPEGWKIKKVGELLEKITRKQKIKTTEYLEKGSYPIIDQGREFIAGFTNDETLVEKDLLPIVIFGDHTRILKYVDFPFVCGADGTQLLFPKNKKLLPVYFYMAIKNIDLGNFHYARHFKFLKEEYIIIPGDEILEKFNNNLKDNFKLSEELRKQNQNLKETRDLLIPRLVSGELDVESLDVK